MIKNEQKRTKLYEFSPLFYFGLNPPLRKISSVSKNRHLLNYHITQRGKIKVLFIADITTWPMCTGGAEVGSHMMLNILDQSYNCKCISVGILPNYEYFKFKNLENILKQQKIKFEKLSYINIRPSIRDYNIKLFPLSIKRNSFWGISFKHYYKSYIVIKNKLYEILKHELLKNKPDIIISQSKKAKKIYKLVNKNNIPIFVYIVDNSDDTPSMIKSIQPYKNIHILYYSNFLKNRFRPILKDHPHTILTPPIDKRNYLVKYNSKKFVTFINPVKQKGVEIFKKIVKRMPEVNFLVVEGWFPLDKVKKEFSKYQNVTFMDKQLDMRNVYNKTKILLIPSVWQEAFGRVAVEAGLNGIPSIASDVGGLNESVGKEGILIKDYRNIDEWIKNINLLLDNDKKYHLYSNAAKKHSKKYTNLSECKKLVNIIKNKI